jgi:predicted dehydrogenase
VELIGVYSRNVKRREAFAQEVDRLELGPCRAHPTLSSLLEDRRLDAVWILVPNDQRLEVMRAIHAAVREKRSAVRAVACEKPLGRTLPEALEMLHLATDAGLSHGYLENEVLCLPLSAVTTLFGAGRCPLREDRTWPAQPKNIRGPMHRGSGVASVRAAGSCRT